MKIICRIHLVDGATDTDVYGLRGSDAAGVFAGANIGRDAAFGFILDGGFLEPAKFTQFDITCPGAANPSLPECVGAGNFTVNSYIGRDPKLYFAERSISGRTREIEIMVIDPVGIAREDTPFASNWETYRTIYTFNKD